MCPLSIQITEAGVSPSRFAKSGYFRHRYQKFFRARHFGQPSPMEEHRARSHQWFIRWAIKASLISGRAFIFPKVL
jgi:hypothetical protein